MVQKIATTDPTGTLEAERQVPIQGWQTCQALERNLLKLKRDRPMALLDLTLGEVLACFRYAEPAPRSR
jgi:hypothetical protein